VADGGEQLCGILRNLAEALSTDYSESSAGFVRQAAARLAALAGECAAAQRETERLRVIPDALETLVVFFEAHATGPGERAYTVAEIAQTVRDWIADAKRIAALSPEQKTEGES
jgi:hypothetical protein